MREINPDDDTAHFEAILSMNRYESFISTFGFPVVKEPVTNGRTVADEHPEMEIRVVNGRMRGDYVTGSNNFRREHRLFQREKVYYLIRISIIYK